MTVHPARTQTTLQSQAEGTQDLSWLSRTYKLTWLCTKQRHRPACNRRHRALTSCHDWVELTNWHGYAPSKDTDHLAIAGTGHSKTCHDWVELTNWHDCAPSKDTDHLAIAGTGHSKTCHDWVELTNWHDSAPSKHTDHLAIAGTGHTRHVMID